MTWVKLEDSMPWHPKVAGLSARAAWLYIKSLCYCSQHLTDGRVSRASLKLLQARSDDCRALVEALLWRSIEGGDFEIVNYLEHQESKEQVEHKRAVERDKKRRQRAASRGDNGGTPGPVPAPEQSERREEKTDPTEQVSAKDLTGSSDAPRQEHAPTQPGFQDRQTVCPLDLAARAHLLKLPEQMAKALEVSEHDVAACVDEFVAYWTIGGGTGQRRENWLAKLREHVRRSHQQGLLIGRAKAPGFEQHEQRKEQERKVAARKRRKQQPEPGQERVPQALRVVLAEQALAAIGGKR